jgi:aminoglycoside 6'-N-acetyltransferase I
MNVRAAESRDIGHWSAMRHALWPDATREGLRGDLIAFFEGKSIYIAAAFIAERDDGLPLGFIELNLRPYAEGCESSPVPHVEGWYVIPTARQSGVGTALMHAAESWAIAHGYHELTSDTTDQYPLSVRAHTANGFKEVERLIAFRKQLR